ncbi:MAG: alcohol dehydrogenase catalytic domain-containing protein [Phycisphaera sp.]|nr:alcohol dehydrogenase catalytic domain-containing protein [Phycisphaera sp.]
MRAMLLTEYKRLEMTDFPEPDVGPGHVLVRVHACGICGSDIHGFDGSSGRRIPPLVMGHEAAGVVESVGEGVTKYQPGDRVTFDSMVSCGACHYCRRGQLNLCDSRRVLGVSCGEYRQHGCFAELVAVPQHIIYRVPDNLSLEHAAMVEPVSVAVHAVNRTPVTLGDTAVVVGAGMIGLLVVQALRAAGCTRVIAVDLDDRKLGMAKSLGAEAGLNPKKCDVLAEVLAMTDGRGADVALECVGATEPIKTAIACVRKGGAVTLVGNLAPTIDLPLQPVVTREITLIGTCGSNGEYPQCIDLMSRGLIDVSPLITKIAPLDEGPALFDRLYAGDAELMKVILTP